MIKVAVALGFLDVAFGILGSVFLLPFVLYGGADSYTYMASEASPATERLGISFKKDHLYIILVGCCVAVSLFC